MAVTSSIDHSTLGWVKTEIDESLKQARQALESYVDDSSDDTQLRFCITHLHQVTGTLEMVELDGAALLAKENEELADAILYDKITPDKTTYEALTRGMLTLPDYLSRLQFGEPDVPIKLVPAVNELRLARNEAELPEIDFFKPDLSIRPPRENPDARKLNEDEVKDLAKTLRPKFQVALLEWLRDTGSEKAINNMVTVLDQLGRDAHLGVVQQLFWVASGLLEAMMNGDLEASNDRKKLLARLDQQIRKLIDGVGKSEIKNTSETLVKNILFQVGKSSAGSPRVTQLRQAFDLDLLLGRVAADSDLDMDRLPTPEVLDSVASALAIEILEAQDNLATYFDPDEPGEKSLSSLVELLTKMSSTMGMLGAPMLKNMVDELVKVASKIDAGEIDASEAISMTMARALLLVESSSQDLVRSATDWKQQINDIRSVLKTVAEGGDDALPSSEGLEVSDGELTDSDFKQLFSVVAGEISTGLARIEDEFETFASDTSQNQHLESIIKLLGQIHGALQIIGQVPAADLVDKTSGYVGSILNKSLSPGEKVLDALAVCIGTIGAYIDGVQNNRPNLDDLLALALGEMNAVSEEAGVEFGDGAQAREMVAASDSGFSDTGSASEQALPDSGILDDEDLDEEIMEIFIEDARDSLATIDKNFPVWRKDPGNREALVEVRRGFHTIKGSGRMVGATEIAELAWSVEELLNKVRDEKIERSESILDLIEHARSVMPDMVVQLEGGAGPTDDIEALRLTAIQMADGGQLDSVPVHDLSASPSVPIAIPETDKSVPELDSALLEIFTGEAREHAQAIEKEVADCREKGGCFAGEIIIRSAHTLAGTARSVGLNFMSTTCKEMENLLLRLEQQQLLLENEYLDLFDSVSQAINKLIESMESSGTVDDTVIDKFSDLQVSLVTIIASLPQQEEGDDLMPTVAAINAAGSLNFDNVAQLNPEPAELDSIDESFAVEAIATGIPDDEIDPELLEIFCEEASDILQNINDSQGRWRSNLGDTAVVAELKRALHTFKGGARMAGAMSLGAVAHNTETLIGQIEQGSIEPSAELLDLLDEIHDSLAFGITQLNEGSPVTELATVSARLDALLAGGDMDAASATDSITVDAAVPNMGGDENIQLEPVAEPEIEIEGLAIDEEINITDIETNASLEASLNEDLADESLTGIEVEEVSTNPAIQSAPQFETAAPLGQVEQVTAPTTTPEAAPGKKEQIRVRTDLLDTLANYAGEVSISRARMEQQIFGFRENLGELDRNVVRFREQLRDLEIQSESQILAKAELEGIDNIEDFDPLEFDRFSRLQQLSRSLTESLHDLTSIQGSLGNFASEAETVLHQQARVNTDLQEGLMRTRLVSFSTQSTRLRHIVRQTSREIGKQAQFEIVGAEVELDRNVLERMIGPFEHMIRNSLDHGIESAAIRRKKDKPASGKIRIETTQQGSEIVILFTDDGAGLNIAAIRNKAIERGLITVDSNLSNEEITQFILMSGFSTAEKVTHISGRGVGMDVVHNEVRQLGGAMSVETEVDKGTTFIIRLPLTLSITQALMVYIGEQLYATPLSGIINILEVPISDMEKISLSGDEPVFNYGDHDYPFMHLGARLEVPSVPRNAKKVPVLLVKSGSRTVAIQVDGLAGTKEIVIKNVGPLVGEVRGISGATILGDGTVVLILDVPDLWVSDDLMHVAHVKAPVVHETEERMVPLIMVVDDSLTVRKITSRHLLKKGMECITAKDGLDALEQLRDHRPDVMLVDIEMPRMDGYELTSRIRATRDLKDIPIIMITSRAGKKHKDKAFSLGVDDYMSKPYQQEELFENIERMLKEGRTP